MSFVTTTPSDVGAILPDYITQSVFKEEYIHRYSNIIMRSTGTDTTSTDSDQKRPDCGINNKQFDTQLNNKDRSE